MHAQRKALPKKRNMSEIKDACSKKELPKKREKYPCSKKACRKRD